MNAIATLPRPALVAVPAADRSPVAVYLASLGSERSRQTMRAALDVIAGLLCGSSAYACPWHELRVEHMAAVRARLVERYAPATANLHLCAVRGVLKACRRLGMLDRTREADLGEIEPARGERVQAGRYVERVELRRLFEACDAGAAGLRDAAALALMVGYGLRRDEAVRLELAAYKPATGDLLVLGKGGKQRHVEGGSNAHRTINAWLAIRGDAPGPLLCPVGKGGKVAIRPMTARSLSLRVQALGERAGVEVSPHDLRRTFASDLLDVADMASVQALMGHASPVTTARYDRRGERARRAAMSRVALPWEP